MLPDGPAFLERISGPATAASSVTKSPIFGAKSMGIKLDFANQSADFFMVSVRCMRRGTEDASVAMAAVVVGLHIVETARRAIDARLATRNRLSLVLRRTGLPRLPRIAEVTRLGMNRRIEY